MVDRQKYHLPFIYIKICKNVYIISEEAGSIKWNNNMPVKVKIKLDIGPAAATLIRSALGLFVAIPAVVSYNKITSDVSKYFMSLESFIDEFTTIIFRQLENRQN